MRFLKMGCVAVLLAGAMIPAFAADASAPVAGTVKTLRGEVAIERGGAKLLPGVGDKLLQGDRVLTGRDGSIGITLRDDTLIAAGPGSQFAIDRFAFDQVTHDGVLETSLARGALRFVSGLLARVAPQKVAIQTPSATIGIRGTEFIVEAGDAR